MTLGFEEVEFGSSRAITRVELEPSQPPAPTAKRPEGVLVPLDQWTSLLNQLGNLHQAGQQLAEARERAAKAETEARFFSERLKEMRMELAEARLQASPTEPIPAPPQPVDQSVATVPDPVPASSPTTDRVLIIKLPSRLTRWWIERRS
ncbi:MAG: hypothetical protein ACR2ME_05940 [Acidimicrobiia bacterium]